MTENVKKGRIKVQHGKLSGKEIEISGESVLTRFLRQPKRIV